MRIQRMGWGGLLRALTAVFVALLATVSALHLFFADARQPDLSADATQPDLSVQEAVAGSEPADTYFELPETAEPALPSISIRLNLDRTAPIAAYLSEAGLSPDEARLWASYFQQISRTRLLRKNHPLTLYKDPETGELRGFRYDVDDRTQVFEATLGSGVVKSLCQPIQYTVRPVSVAFAIRENFEKAVERNHLPGPVVETLEQALSGRYKLDHPGTVSAVKLIYNERVSRDGAHRIPGDVEAVEVRYGTGTMRAFAFRDEHGRAHLYDESGRALGPQFLRFPLDFQYISSGFSLHRYHPILHAYRPHVGVDLVARYGTPVKAIADGRVETAGWCGELGNCVRIEHDNHVSSIYGHLARISPSVAAGSDVRIGQVIGRVGSTGLSTGPHLHFALERRGTYLNPLTEKLGVNHEVSPRLRTLFEGIKERYRLALAKLPDMGSQFATSQGGTSSEPGASPAYRAALKRNPRVRIRHRSRSYHRSAVRTGGSLDTAGAM